MRQTRSGNLKFPAWKFEAPRLGTCLLTRERLLGTVEQCVGGAKPSSDILLVSAPAGYGKTTLLAQWAVRATIPVIWYHLDRSDQDPATLLRGITAALHRKFPRQRWNVESLLTNVRGGLPGEADLQRAYTVLSADIEQHIARPAALILTGVAELGGSPLSLAVLDSLLSRPLDHLRLALEWREAPQLRFSSLIAQHRIRAIGRDDLCLTDDELHELLTEAGAPEDTAFRDQIQQLTSGWVTGVVLAVGVLTPLPMPGSDELDYASVNDYLAHQVISALPPELRDFATEAAVLEYMTPDLCAHLLKIPVAVARERLGALERTTGFVSRTGQRPQALTYRFQSQLRQALLARLNARTKGRKRRLALHHLAAQLLEHEQDHNEAIRHYHESGDSVAIADLVEAVHDEYLRASRGLLLSRWLDLLPETLMQSRPHLQLLQAELYRQSGRGSQALALAKRTYSVVQPAAPQETGSSSREYRDACRLAAHAAVICAEVQRDLGAYYTAQQACHEALAWLSRCAQPDSVAIEPEGLYARAYETLSATVMLTDGPLAAERYLQVCEQYSLYSGDLWQVGRHHYYRSKIYIQEGKFIRAESAAVAALLAAQDAHDEICAVVSRLNP